LSVEVSATDRSFLQRSPTECVCVSHLVRSGVTIILYTYNEQVEKLPTTPISVQNKTI